MKPAATARRPQQARRRTRRKTNAHPTGPLAALLALAANLGAKLLSFLRSASIQRRVRRMHLVERISISNKHSVTLLRVDDQEFIVGCSGESVVMLGTLSPKMETESSATAKPVPTQEDLLRAFRRVQ
jgi:flagellar biogenesis protein FliO